MEEEKALIQIQNTSVTLTRINNIIETTNKLLNNDDRELIEWWKGLDGAWQFLFYINISKDAFDPKNELYTTCLNFYSGLEDLNYQKTLVEIKSLNLEKLNEIVNLETFNISFKITIPKDNVLNIIVDFQLIKSFRPLEKLKRLKSLSIQGLKKMDLNSITLLNSITDLKIMHCDFVDFVPITKMFNLVSLMLYNNSLVEIIGLENLTNIRLLDLSSNKITSIIPLSNLTNLTYLNLSFNPIIDWLPIKKLTNIKHLDLRGNKTESVDNFIFEFRDVKNFYFDIHIYKQLIEQNYFKEIFQKKLEYAIQEQEYFSSQLLIY